jgi:hypothetical protein
MKYQSIVIALSLIAVLSDSIPEAISLKLVVGSTYYSVYNDGSLSSKFDPDYSTPSTYEDG